MADSTEKKSNGLYLAMGEWATFSFLFHSQALGLGLAWMLDQAACNTAADQTAAATKAGKWRTKYVTTGDPDAEQATQEKLFAALSKSCCAVIKNMKLLMLGEGISAMGSTRRRARILAAPPPSRAPLLIP